MSSILSRLSRAWYRSSSLCSRPTCRFTPGVEILEGRVNPAGTLTTNFSLGTLTISAADDLTAVPGLNNQDITITGAGAGSFNLTGNDGENFIGDGTSFSNVTNIRLLMRLGSDIVTVTSANLAGTLTCLGGSGNNQLLIDGNNTIRHVSITNGDGNDEFQVRNGTNLITGNLIINNGQGNSTTRFGDAGGDITTVNGKVRVTNGDGFDNFDFNGVSVTLSGAVTIKNGSGGSNTSVDADSNTIGGAFSITNGDGEDDITFGGNSASLRSLIINQSSGAGNLEFNSTTTTITGNLSFTSTAGDDFIDVNGDSFTVTGATTFSTGSGHETFFFDAVVDNTFGSTLKVLTGAGDDNLTIGESIATSNDFRSIIVNTGTGNNGITFGGLTVNGSITVTSGDGDDNIDVNGNNFDVSGSVTINSGTGGDLDLTIDASNNNIDGTLRVTNGDGNDEIFFGGTTVDLAGVVISNGAGGSEVQFNAGTHNLTSLQVTCGNGFDFINVDNNFIVTGSAAISLGSGGSDVNLDGGSNSFGALTVKTLDGEDSVLVHNVNAAGAVLLDLGNGHDEVDIQDSTFNGVVTVNTGNGADEILVETDDTGSETIFNKRVTINMGAGGDNLDIGTDGDDFADFNAAPVKLIGGLDLDIISALDIPNNLFPAGQPVESGWEQGT